MKQFFKIIIMLIITISLVGCAPKKGDISNCENIKVESNIFEEKDLNEAIEVVLNYFEENYIGCELLNIKYIGDDKNTYNEWALRNNKEETIVFKSDFIVHDNSEVQTLNEEKYEGWHWILIRNKGEKWSVIDYGF